MSLAWRHGTAARLAVALFAASGSLAPAAADSNDPPAPAAPEVGGPPPAARPPVASPTSDRDTYRAMAREAAKSSGLPPDFADAIMEVESGYHPGSVGAAGEVGLMQVMPSTARMMGFEGSIEELATPEVNIRYGVTYLAQAWRLAGGDICTAAMKYRAGHGETRFSYLSVDYCLRVRAALTARGYQVTGTVPTATFGSPTRSGGGRMRLVIGRGPDLGALNNQMRALADAASSRAGFHSGP
jgi:soluble lytic murein transglycosylase-like protein